MHPPNVLVFCFDHFPGLLMGAAGNRDILTPTLDHLCACGTRYSQAYSATPICIPARRALMTGTTAKTHGDRIFQEKLAMDPRLPTLPQVFREVGYQSFAVGKLHVYPQRDRIGFDEVILNEEGRHHLDNIRDDYELYLADQGYCGQELTHAMGNNAYTVRPWHLPEHCHPTHWTARQMCRAIQRHDPTRPAFWYCSFSAPHPPVTPPADYLDMYRELGIGDPLIGDWARDPDQMPYALRRHRSRMVDMSERAIRLARLGFYAQCTYIDHQMRLVIGTLREQGLLDNTMILVTSDHGDMLGNHNLFGKPPMLEYSVKIPMILVPHSGCERVGIGQVDERLAELRDVMPTVLDLCGIPIPKTVEGESLLSGMPRKHLYCELHEGAAAMRMIRADRYKLIWYPVGNRFQLFDLENDPMECEDLGQDPAHQSVVERLCALLRDELYGSDLGWVQDGKLVGEPNRAFVPMIEKGLVAQRGWR